MRLEAQPFSRDITTYWDDIWEVHLGNILADETSTSILSSLSLEPLEVLFENQCVKNKSIDFNNHSDVHSNTYDGRFYPKMNDTTKSSPHISLTAIYSHFVAIKRKDTTGACIKRGTRGKRNNNKKQKDRKKETILQKNQISLFFQRQKKFRSVKRYIDETDDMVRFGLFAGDIDKRHEACAIDGINLSTSMNSHKDCVCRSFVICRSPLRQEIQ